MAEIQGAGSLLSPETDVKLSKSGLGFAERVRGSHHVFVRSGIQDMINLQREGRLAKPYQVRQVREVITAYALAVGKED